MKMIIWDWNGTIVNDAELNWRLFNGVMAEIAYPPVSFGRYQELYKHPIIDMYRDAGVDLDAHSFDAIITIWGGLYERIEQHADLHHDVHETLTHVSNRGYRQAVLSALPETMLLEAVSTYKLGKFFERVRGLPTAHGTSKVEAGIALVESLGVSPSSVVIVGDSSHDAEVAQAVGSDCILVSRGLESATSLGRHGFPVVDDFTLIREL